jgi:CRP/FNR family transcriptional regulator, cyclic AMP receptor protein
MDGHNGTAVLESCQACKLRSEDAFCNLSGNVLEALDQISYSILYPEHAVLFSEGQTCQGVFILCSGKVKLFASSGDSKKIMLRIALAGELLGLSSALTASLYDVTAETLTPAIVRLLKRNDFLQFMASFPGIHLHMLNVLSREYGTALESLRSLAWFPTAKARIAQLLLHLCVNGTSSRRELRTKLVLTQEQIGQMTATSRETVARMLSELRKSRIISLRGPDLVIKNRSALERLVG